MRKIIISIILIGLVILFYFFVWQDKSPSTLTNTSPTNDEKGFHPDPSNATFTIDDEQVTLSNGRYQNNSISGEEVTLFDKFAYGDVNNDGKNDTALFLVELGGGSGTFIYLGAYVSGPVTYRGTNTTFIGDRISPQSISINNGIVTIIYLDRKDGEAFAAEPTVKVTKQFIYKNSEFVER